MLSLSAYTSVNLEVLGASGKLFSFPSISTRSSFLSQCRSAFLPLMPTLTRLLLDDRRVLLDLDAGVGL